MWDCTGVVALTRDWEEEGAEFATLRWPRPDLVKNPDPSFPPLQDSSAAGPPASATDVWFLQVPASYKRHILMDLPLLCLIAVSLPPPPPSWPSPPHPPSASLWPLANPLCPGFRVRAADSQPTGRLPRGADIATSSRRDVRDPGTPLMSRGCRVFTTS